MSPIFCDIHVCACPDIPAGKERFDEYIDRIVALRDLSQLNNIQIVYSEESLATLCAEGKYPIRPKLEQAISTFNNEVIQAKDVIEIIDSLIARSINIMSLIGEGEILLDNFTSHPDIVISNREPNSIDALKRFLILSTQSHTPAKLITVDAAPTNQSIIITSSISVSDIPSLEEGSTITQSISLHISKKEIYAILPIETIWQYCHTTDQYYFTINAFLALNDSTIDCTDVCIIPNSFIDSSRRHGFTHEAIKIRRLLRAILETISRTALSSTHAIRENRGPDSAQILNGDYKAWRRDIDHEYHIHYWDTGKMIRFSSLVVHNDFSIRW